jgi:hypothetical protein
LGPSKFGLFRQCSSDTADIGPGPVSLLMMGDAELLGVGSDALEKLKFLQNPACTFGNGAQRVIGDVHRQTGFLGDEPVNTAQQRATSGHDNTSIYQIGR